MLVSCRYCGRIHDRNYVCDNKPKIVYKNKKERTKEDRLRGLQVWKKKRKLIADRDNHMCQICSRDIFNTYGSKYNYDDNIQVHHIVPIVEDETLWLEDDNLICLCRYHHERAEKGQISKEVLKQIAENQNSKYEL